ncbi:MAG TPA: tRNA glutamyl-Q(34) synthetase GluQRS [Casimicrobiaceae bacterium]|nr:tRNA glutamyl-Q(34) synthetase GluQRS [Casimicrobiaceae bacterium]
MNEAAAIPRLPTESAPARYRGRFAPSPTGPLHFGSLVAALASFCDARSAGGKWLLRIEDVDLPRSRRGADTHILATLDRYGFEWDEAITWQSRRTRHYDDALARLQSAGLVYECACTRHELEAAPVGAGGERIYPGHCRNGIPSAHRSRPRRSWRLRVGDAVVECHDRRQPAQRQAMEAEVGDFVVKRSDGLFAYQLAVVVDDGEQGVTDVVRGADLLASTPRQVLLQQWLGLSTPSYLHVPVAINATGEKLSKQTGAAPLPDAPMPALLAAWSFLDQPPFPAQPVSVAEFWKWAHSSWRASRVPPVPMLPAPPAVDRRRGS